MSDEEVLLIEKLDGGIVRLTLNRPDQRNALSSDLRKALADTMEDISADDTLKAVMLMARGPVFCAGFDLKELAEGHTETVFAEARIYHHRIYHCSKPLLAVIDGPAYAGGMDLAALCDIRIGSDQAVFAQPQVKMGVPAAFDLMKTVLPEGLARDICLSGRKMDAREALQAGFLTERLADTSQLESRAMEKVLELAGAGAGLAMKKTILKAQPALFES